MNDVEETKNCPKKEQLITSTLFQSLKMSATFEINKCISI
ncbi:hypothetical protein GCM10008013_22670 [Paenibacillus segetis]|uniref:Uncharacterized protein n=1 Tax=Paenibacillus segetis TaxID=1325360 RepID=A0ABQ1YFL7_9BACL|nr:hypothetical protein GCM10008013_22670 [Paenibacillus segetis]